VANRSRLRRKLRRLLTEWGSLAERGDAVDQSGFTPAYLTSPGRVTSSPAAAAVMAETPWAESAFGMWAGAYTRSRVSST